jgi:GalNAc-alpha-(1->4)-GalNAc-alpha-(1->3)-diNAcBac-PP-undecaprenol alpha-1,4-N-acetyl-D-galactosaminyltransferase
MNPTRLVLVIPTLKGGGAERVISQLANEWAARGYEVHLVTWYRHSPYYALHADVRHHALDLLAIPSEGTAAAAPAEPAAARTAPSKPRALQRLAKHPLLRPLYKDFVLLKEVANFRRLRKHLVALQPDVVLSFASGNNFLTLLALSGTSIPAVVSERSTIKSDRRLDLHAFLRRLTYRRAGNVIAQTSAARRDYVEQTGYDRCVVIPNPVKRMQAPAAAPREPVILSVGSLVQHKGQHLLLEAFARLDAPAWRLVLVGEGPERKALEQQAARLDIADRVEFAGWRADVDAVYASASVFVLSSLREGFPNVLAEAMVSGLCCVSFDCDYGPRDLIADGDNGFLVPAADAGALARQLQYIVDRPEVRAATGAEARKLADRLDIGAIGTQYLRVLTEAFENR